jgi:hypothetical protein
LLHTGEKILKFKKKKLAPRLLLHTGEKISTRFVVTSGGKTRKYLEKKRILSKSSCDLK